MCARRPTTTLRLDQLVRSSCCWITNSLTAGNLGHRSCFFASFLKLLGKIQLNALWLIVTELNYSSARENIFRFKFSKLLFFFHLLDVLYASKHAWLSFEFFKYVQLFNLISGIIQKNRQNLFGGFKTRYLVCCKMLNFFAQKRTRPNPQQLIGE